jgi:hypothetical protein
MHNYFGYGSEKEQLSRMKSVVVSLARKFTVWVKKQIKPKEYA